MIKASSKTIGNTAIEQKDVFLDILLRTLDATVLGNFLLGKDIIQASEETVKAGATTTS